MTTALDALQNFQSAIREVNQRTTMRCAEKLAMAVEVCADPEVLVKIYNALKVSAQAEPEKKLDPNAGLATFNITFSSAGGVQQVIAPPPLVEIVQEVQPALPEPTDLVKAGLAVNADLLALLEEIQ